MEGYEYDPYGKHTLILDGSDVDSAVNFDATDQRFAGDSASVRSLSGNVCTFTGKPYDRESGLHWYNARYYAAALGAFVSHDPAEELGEGEAYLYCSDSPANATDPTGLWKQDIDDATVLSTKERRSYCAAKDDTFESLASSTGFDQGEIEKVIKLGESGPIQKSGKPTLGAHYTVPNAVYFVYGYEAKDSWLQLEKDSAKPNVEKFRQNGYHVSETSTANAIMAALQSKNGFGFVFLGHGVSYTKKDWPELKADFYSGSINGPVNQQYWNPTREYDPIPPGASERLKKMIENPKNKNWIAVKMAHHKLPYVRIMACFSANAQWKDLSSKSTFTLDYSPNVGDPWEIDK